MIQKMVPLIFSSKDCHLFLHRAFCAARAIRNVPLRWRDRASRAGLWAASRHANPGGGLPSFQLIQNPGVQRVPSLQEKLQGFLKLCDPSALLLKWFRMIGKCFGSLVPTKTTGSRNTRSERNESICTFLVISFGDNHKLRRCCLGDAMKTATTYCNLLLQATRSMKMAPSLESSSLFSARWTMASNTGLWDKVERNVRNLVPGPRLFFVPTSVPQKSGRFQNLNPKNSWWLLISGSPFGIMDHQCTHCSQS